MWDRLIQIVERKVAVWGVCFAYGAVYGAVSGAACGTCLFPGAGTMIGAMLGLLMGALCGCVSGIVGNIVGGRAGWCLAGLLGGMAPALLLWPEPGLDALVAPGFVRVAALTPVLIGGALGLAVGCGLRSGRSSVPGVQEIIEIIHDARPPHRSAPPLNVPTEVMPVKAPEGQGDEAAPAEDGPQDPWPKRDEV